MGSSSNVADRSLPTASVAQECGRLTKVYVIGKVKELCPELDKARLRPREILHERKIPVAEAGTPQNTIAHVSDHVDRWCHKAARVKPAIDGRVGNLAAAGGAV